jgi:hypothetical protein
MRSKFLRWESIPPLSLRSDPTFTRAPWRLGFAAQSAIRRPPLKTGKSCS